MESVNMYFSLTSSFFLSAVDLFPKRGLFAKIKPVGISPTWTPFVPDLWMGFRIMVFLAGIVLSNCKRNPKKP